MKILDFSKRFGWIPVMVTVALASGIAVLTLPNIVPVANKRGNSNVFALASTNAAASAGTVYCDDGSGNLTSSGCNPSAGAGLVTYSNLIGLPLTGTIFIPIGGATASVTENEVKALVVSTTTFSNMGVSLSVALGTGNSVVLTWRKNASSQTLTCTITDPANTCNDTTHSFSVAPGDLVDIQAAFTGTITATPIFNLVTQVGTLGAGGSTAFSSITSGPNTAASMILGSGSSMSNTGTGLTDFSSGGSTVPARVASGAPTGTNCSKVGEVYFQSNATAGQNLWLATTFGTPCTWTQVTGGGGGGGSFTLVEAHTASNSAQLAFTTCLSSTYQNYQIVIAAIVPATDQANINMEVSTNGGSSYDTSNNYSQVGERQSLAGTAGNVGTNAQPNFGLDVAGNVTNSTNTGSFNAILNFFNPLGGVSFPTLNWTASTYDGTVNPNVWMISIGTYRSTTAVNAFRIVASTGNLTSGTVRCYGLSN